MLPRRSLNFCSCATWFLDLANVKLVQKGECWTWNQRFIRGLGSLLTGGNILSLDFFCFHIVKPLMPILALLPFLCISKRGSLNWAHFILEWFIRFLEFAEFTEFLIRLGKTPLLVHNNFQCPFQEIVMFCNQVNVRAGSEKHCEGTNYINCVKPFPWNNRATHTISPVYRI